MQICNYRWKFYKWEMLVTQLCPTLCNTMDCSLPGSSAHGSLQARILEWVAISFSTVSSQPRDPGFPHCRWIIYHLSYQRSPINGNWKKVKVKVAQLCLTICDHMGSFSGQNTGVGSLLLFQGIFPTQGSNPGLPHCKQILFQLSHKGSPRILEWVAYPFPKGSSQTRVSCIAGRFFTNWAIREAHKLEG